MLQPLPLSINDDSPLSAIQRIQDKIVSARTDEEHIALLNAIKEALQQTNITPQEIAQLKKWRQRIYDRRRQSPSKQSSLAKNRSEDSDSTPLCIAEPVPEEPENKPPRHKQKRSQLILPFLLLAILGSAWLLWQQSVPLYSGIGFTTYPELVAAGGLLLMLGFAGYQAFFPSIIGLLLCTYISAYEIYFVVSATTSHDQLNTEKMIVEDPQLLFLQEATQQAKTAFESNLERYNDASSKVYNNRWFHRNHVSPRWQEYEQKVKDLGQLKLQLEEKQSHQQTTSLKIMYRLGLVFLMMISTHKFLHLIRNTNFKMPTNSVRGLC